MFKLLAAVMLSVSLAHADESCPPLLDFTVPALVSHQPVHLCSAYRNKVILVVNTASKCGYTYQYEGLETLYQEFHEQGLVVLGFPSNDFGGQEPGSEEQVAQFCRLTYGVAFPMFAKSSVRKGAASPFYRALGEQAGYPRWNFHKYLIGRDGKLLASFPSNIKPRDAALMREIKRALKD